MSKFYLRIATPESDFFCGEIEYLSVDTPDGRAGFMRGALPRVAVVSAGYIEISDDGDKKRFDCGDGVLCVDADGVIVVTSYCADSVKDGGVTADGENIERTASDREHDYAKARIMSAMYKLKNKDNTDDR